MERITTFSFKQGCKKHKGFGKDPCDWEKWLWTLFFDWGKMDNFQKNGRRRHQLNLGIRKEKRKNSS
jgi:hypothetical protein